MKEFNESLHIIYTYKGKVYSVEKNWTFGHAEDVLKRLGASYWEIGIPDNRVLNVRLGLLNKNAI